MLTLKCPWIIIFNLSPSRLIYSLLESWPLHCWTVFYIENENGCLQVKEIMFWPQCLERRTNTSGQNCCGPDLFYTRTIIKPTYWVEWRVAICQPRANWINQNWNSGPRFVSVLVGLRRKTPFEVTDWTLFIQVYKQNLFHKYSSYSHGQKHWPEVLFWGNSLNGCLTDNK